MTAGAEGKAGVKDQLDPVGVVLLPRGHHSQTAADLHGVVVFAPAVLPVLLLHALGLHGVGDVCSFHAGGNEGQRFHGGSARLQIHMDDNGIAGPVQQLLFDQVHMGDLGHLLLDVAVVFDIDAALGDHGSNGFGVVSVGLGHGQADISPFHNAVSFYFASSPSPSLLAQCHLPQSGRPWQSMQKFAVLPRALPLGELDAKRPERAHVLYNSIVPDSAVGCKPLGKMYVKRKEFSTQRRLLRGKTKNYRLKNCQMRTFDAF